MAETIDQAMEVWERDLHQQSLKAQAIEKLCQKLTLDDPVYLARLKDSLHDGTCPGEVQALLLRIALGKL